MAGLFLSFAQPSNHASLIPSKAGRKQAGDISENDAGSKAAQSPTPTRLPVSSLVNSPKTDDPRCIEPLRIDRDFSEKKCWGDD